MSYIQLFERIVPNPCQCLFVSLLQDSCNFQNISDAAPNGDETAVIQAAMTPISGVNNGMESRRIPTAAFPPHWSP